MTGQDLAVPHALDVVVRIVLATSLAAVSGTTLYKELRSHYVAKLQRADGGLYRLLLLQQ